MNKDILVCGVGGQGTVLASKLIASAYMANGALRASFGRYDMGDSRLAQACSLSEM